MKTDEIYGYLNCFLDDNCTFSVIPCDFLSKFRNIRYPLYLVVNNDESTKPGSHWLTLYQQSEESPLVFIDSYGRSIDAYNKAIGEFAERQKTSLYEGDRVLQSIYSDVCGQYAIFFLYKLFKEKGCIGNLYKGFSYDTNRNDRIVENFVNKKVCRLSSVIPITNQCCKRFIEQ
jgi:hypothetical protein